MLSEKKPLVVLAPATTKKVTPPRLPKVPPRTTYQRKTKNKKGGYDYQAYEYDDYSSGGYDFNTAGGGIWSHNNDSSESYYVADVDNANASARTSNNDTTGKASAENLLKKADEKKNKEDDRRRKRRMLS